MTSRQAEILAYIGDYITAQGYPPTIREIAAEHGITSPNGVACHLLSLERQGLITRDPSVSRGIRIVPDAGECDRCPMCGAKRRK